MSTRAIYLENGVPKVFGSPEKVVKAYLADVHQ
jgi:ABC-type polysaccharide/polyol phosphate transport system ATPase subunit